MVCLTWIPVNNLEIHILSCIHLSKHNNHLILKSNSAATVLKSTAFQSVIYWLVKFNTKYDIRKHEKTDQQIFFFLLLPDV